MPETRRMERGSHTKFAFRTPRTQAALSGVAKEEFVSERAHVASCEETISRPPPSRYRFTRSLSVALKGGYCSRPTCQITARRAWRTVRLGRPSSATLQNETRHPFDPSEAAYEASRSGGNETLPIMRRTSPRAEVWKRYRRPAFVSVVALPSRPLEATSKKYAVPGASFVRAIAWPVVRSVVLAFRDREEALGP